MRTRAGEQAHVRPACGKIKRLRVEPNVACSVVLRRTAPKNDASKRRMNPTSATSLQKNGQNGLRAGSSRGKKNPLNRGVENEEAFGENWGKWFFGVVLKSSKSGKTKEKRGQNRSFASFSWCTFGDSNPGPTD